MYVDGKLLTAGEKTRLHSEPFGVRKYLPDKCYDGYTLYSLLSEDYDGPSFGNSKIRAKLKRVENVWIMPTNNFPQTDLSAETKPKIRGTIVYNVNNSLTAGLIMTPESLAAVWTGGIMPYVDWLPERRSTNIGAATFKGINTFRPEACAEITITGS